MSHTKRKESSYLKRREQREVHVEEGRRNKSPCLGKHILLSPPTSESICTLGTSEHFKVGQFHEIDHSNLSPISKQGSCWFQLKFPGMTQWGQRRHVRFMGRHEEQKVESLLELCKEKGVSVEHREGTREKGRQKGEEETEADKAGSFGAMRMTHQCKRTNQNMSNSSSAKKSKKARNDTKKQLVVYSKNKRKVSINRWSAERYNLAEENILKVMKGKGAVYGNPILRPDLRSEARKHIGDTGLLDHLLKHMAGKVAPGGVERFRRRYNAEGAMEYWLESADLVDIRKEAGIQDPYWTPPPGWKLGDNISQDYITSRELKEIKEEILKLKQDMQELVSKQGEEALTIVTTPSSSLSSLNFESHGSLVPKQVKHRSKEQLGLMKPTIVEENNGGERRKEKKGNNNKETKLEDTQMLENSTTKDKAAKIERLKSGFQICKPPGTFVWPNLGVSPHVVANLDDLTLVRTPSSVSSSTTSAPKLVSTSQTQDLLLLTPNPPSPIKPLAERRPVSIVTLTHVTSRNHYHHQ
ncbi:hypothetical protein VNO77_39033 [Canavalia gladiata]|uniref:PTC1-like winged helix-turn-helix domain-containing protein n=1 Tax=Canavalia gladiata TaxID=3824 RepID=A0AAN9KBY0_CANGL